MADYLYFSRNTKVYMEVENSNDSNQTVFEIPILDGLSFTQSMAQQEISLNEASASDGTTRRGRQVFNNNLEPGEWSFQTYIRPFKENDSDYATDDIHVVDGALWNALVGAGEFNASTTQFDNITSNDTNATVSFSNTNKPTVGEFTLKIVLEESNTSARTCYNLAKCVVNEVTVDFDIDGIATASWSGFFQSVTNTTDNPGGATHIDDGVDHTDNFIRNKLSTVTLDPNFSRKAGGEVTSTINGGTAMDITITGGSFTYSNNITYLTPNTLGSVNIPLGHVTGTKTVSGNLSMYLADDGTSTNQSLDLFQDLIEDSTTEVHEVSLNIKIGGATGNRMEILMDHCHLELPTHSFDDIISLDVAYHALPDNADMSLTDEVTSIIFDV